MIQRRIGDHLAYESPLRIVCDSCLVTKDVIRSKDYVYGIRMPEGWLVVPESDRHRTQHFCQKCADFKKLLRDDGWYPSEGGYREEPPA